MDIVNEHDHEEGTDCDQKKRTRVLLHLLGPAHHPYHKSCKDEFHNHVEVRVVYNKSHYRIQLGPAQVQDCSCHKNVQE